jgi:hypothetical protein
MKAVFTTLLVLATLMAVPAAEGGEADGEDGKLLSGISILGNDEAPKSLVIVPWKSSAPTDVLEASRALDDGRRPVDREVFERSLAYYRIRSGGADPIRVARD